MTTLLLVICILVAVALIFDFTNRFHDAANSIVTGTLSSLQAVCLAAFFNFIAMWVFELKIVAF